MIALHDNALANIAMFNYSGAKDRMTGEHLASYYGPTWKQFITGNTAPDYLKGQMAGDFGYDILRLGESSPERLETYRQAVTMHGRWAVLGVVDMLAPEALNV